MYSLRIFVSYARKDQELAIKLAEKLKSAGHFPLVDSTDIDIGSPFSDEIKGLIAYSHLFIPLITETAKNSVWVLQEIGFATALNIPVLPIIIEPEETPVGLISTLQAIRVNANLEKLDEKLNPSQLERLVTPKSPRPTKMFDVAEWPETRTEMLIESAERELLVNNYGCVRQKAAFSSFYIPQDASKKVWNDLEGKIPMSPYYRHLLGQERRILGEHANHKGFKLIIYPNIKRHHSGIKSIIARLKSLREFLEGFNEELCNVVISSSALQRNVTILGDWLVAESRLATNQGYRNTMFKFHSPTVLKVIKEFDEEFRKIEQENASSRDEPSQRGYVLNMIERRIDELSLQANDNTDQS